MSRNTTPWGAYIIPWSSLPKWVYEQRVSDAVEDLPNWHMDTDHINNFEIRIRPLEGDPNVEDYDEGLVYIYAYSKKDLLDKLRHYRKTFYVLEEDELWARK